MAKKTRKHNYVVGFTGEGNCIFGKVPGRRIKEVWTTANPMTLNQATSMIKELHGSPKVIYRLVPLATFTKGKKR